MTRIALLWHMHQPFYQDLETGEHVLPWVRLHALKDYFGMAALLREFPEVRVTFNLVPSLLVQLEAFAENRARDRYLDLGLKPAADLTAADRAFIVTNFFHAQRQRMIEPYARYRELLGKREAEKRGAGPQAGYEGQEFDESDLRDLQVWQKLVWIDPIYLEGDERIKSLLEKGRDFSEADKAVLRTVELELLNRVIPEYREALRRDQAELSTSPFYHPILPLLCDTDVYLRTHPHSRMPRLRFRHPEDAAEQLARAVRYYEQLFGKKPDGVWPSEGSVSEEMVPLVQAARFQWMASDELVVARTLGRVLSRDHTGQLEEPETLYRPYLIRTNGGEVACVFRDHTLSDLIGFTYGTWDPQVAADDFVRRLKEAGQRFSGRTSGEEAVIAIILDGENAWEHFHGGGRPFLRALYQRLSADAELRTVTVAGACSGRKAALDTLFPASWINGDFYIWIGHDDDRKAWGQLAEARNALDEAGPDVEEAAKREALEEILIAEGSDWFWWYGDDHSSDQDAEFDELFRRHVANAYRKLRRPVPDELFVSNISTSVTAGPLIPSTFIRPTIDGEATSYFEWIGAATVEPRQLDGTMHQAVDRSIDLATAIHFGFDLERLFVRVDFARRAVDVMRPGRRIVIGFVNGRRLELRIEDGSTRGVLSARQGGDWLTVEPSKIEAAAADILEVSVAFADLNLQAGDEFGFFVSMTSNGSEVRRYPPRGPITSRVPTPEFEAFNWTV